MYLPSEIIEPFMQKMVGQMWYVVEVEKRSRKSLRKMLNGLYCLSRFAEVCNATHCSQALRNYEFFIFCLLDERLVQNEI